jgi:hypothetical protein
MSIRELLTVVFSSTVFFTALGGGVGFVLGKFLPAYYRSIFRHGNDEGFDPLAMGIGQGLTQGMTAGAVVGVVLAIVLTWSRVRTFVPPRGGEGGTGR